MAPFDLAQLSELERAETDCVKSRWDHSFGVACVSVVVVASFPSVVGYSRDWGETGDRNLNFRINLVDLNSCPTVDCRIDSQGTLVNVFANRRWNRQHHVMAEHDLAVNRFLAMSDWQAREKTIQVENQNDLGLDPFPGRDPYEKGLWIPIRETCLAEVLQNGNEGRAKHFQDLVFRDRKIGPEISFFAPSSS